MARSIMIQGTMSNAGKSLIAAGLCRIFKQDGYRVAPFKSQNMALNSFITNEGLEMGRAQVVQAEACGIEPSVDMNPILLKPTTDMGSQVIINGEVLGNMRALEYYKHKREYIPMIKAAYDRLDARYDIIVIEGAGSPAEINLKQDDIVNMGMAELADAPVLLVGDIDRGGVFAQLIGTVMLLEPEEQNRIKGLIINKFRGDKKILEPGLDMIEDKCGKRVIGVVPYADVDIEDEDSLAARLQQTHIGMKGRNEEVVDIAVIRLPKISNFTDFQALALESQVSVRYVTRASELGTPDVVILPGTKNTISDLKWLRENGLESRLIRLASEETLIVGICGGYQMLGESVTDTYGMDGTAETLRGMGLLPVRTYFEQEKMRTQISGRVSKLHGIFASLSGKNISGYEIHMGRTEAAGETDVEFKAIFDLNGKRDGCYFENVLGTYLHGLFDEEDFRRAFVSLCCERKGVSYGQSEEISYQDYKERQFDRLADILRENLNINEIYRIMGIGKIE